MTDLDKNMGIQDAELIELIKKELLTGYHAEAVMATIRQNRIARANSRLQSAMIEGVGQRTMSIDATVYHHWNHVEPGCWRDRSFTRKFLKDHPECKAPEAIRKIQVVNQFQGSRRKQSRGSLIAA